MAVTRRKFLKTSGAVAVGAAAAGTGLTAREAKAQEVPYSTIEAGLEYEIELGRVNEIKIVEKSPPLPPFAPAGTQVDFGNVVFKYNLKVVRSGIRFPNDLRLWLFRPKESVADLTTIYDPPSYVGHGAKGHYTLRYPAGDNTFPRKENTPLWQKYIEPNWELVPGAHFTFDDLVPGAEANNTEWLGPRAVSAFHNADQFDPFPSVVPLRVAREGIHRDGELLLSLLEIRRKGRLRLMARTVMVKHIIGRGICVAASVAPGAAMAADLNALRRFRNQKLIRTSVGRSFVRMYYRTSPSMVRLLERFPALKKIARLMLSRLARIVRLRLR